MTPDSGILTALLGTFQATFQAGFGPVKADALSLLAVLAAIELTVAVLFWLLKGEDALVGLVQKILLIGMFLFFVTQWPALVMLTLKGFEQTGLKAGGGAAGISTFANPSAIIDYGFAVTLPIQNEIDSLSSGTFGALGSIGPIIMLGWAEIGILMAFFILAIQAFVTYLEFYLVTVLALILVPFGVFRHTSFIAEKAFGVVIGHGVKLMVLAFILSAALPVLSSLSMPTDPSVRTAWCMLLASGAIMFLAWHAPGIAGGMMAGGPSLSAGAAAGTVIAAGTGVVAAGMGGAWALARSRDGAAATLRAAGALQTGAQMGALDSALSGGGAAARAAGAAHGATRVAASAASAPFVSVRDRMAQKLREGNLRGYDISRGTGFSTAAGVDPASGTAGTAAKSGPSGSSMATGVKWTRAVVPPEAHPQGGMSAPIRHEN